MRESLATQIRLHRRFFSLLHPPALEPSLPDLIFLFSTNYFSTPRGYLKIKKLLHTFSMEIRMAPEVGFEPTRPEGAQADRRAYSRHGPACYADCPVPRSGI